MLNAIFRPLTKWPGTPTADAARINAPFQAEYQATLDLLEFELNKIGAHNVTIQIQIHPSQIRNDGWLKGGASVSGPAVLLSFTGSDGQQYSYPCDTFKKMHHNLRAIALALEALRKIDRYGVTRRGEQYQGFRELPAAASQQKKMQPNEAAAFIASKVPGVDAGVILTDQQMFETIFKLAQRRVHPDTGGSQDDFVHLQDAGAVLIECFKTAKAGGGV